MLGRVLAPRSVGDAVAADHALQAVGLDQKDELLRQAPAHAVEPALDFIAETFNFRAKA